MKWLWPLRTTWFPIPKPGEPGAFGTVRKHDIHTGVDLYCVEGEKVTAVELGIIVGIERFTGDAAGSPWWLETWAVLIEGKSGVVAYGELKHPSLTVGNLIAAGDLVGFVGRVLPHDKGRPTSMLHLELYEPGTTSTAWWRESRPEKLLDPTPFLLEAQHDA